MSHSLIGAMRSSTALSPTHHKGGGLKSVIGIAAGAVIPFAAPIVASAIGFSNVVASAVIGAGMGAGVAALSGGNPLIGAIGGGVAGGFGGAAQGYSMLGDGTPGTAIPTAGVTSTMGGVTYDPGYAGGLTVQPTAGLTTSMGGMTYDPGYAGGVTAAGFSDVAGASGIPMSTGASFVPQAAPKVASTFADKAKNFFGSDAVKAGLAKGGVQLLSNALVTDPGLTPEEKANMAALQEARAMQADLLGEKRALAKGFLKQATDINPEYYGQLAMTEGQNRLTRAQQAGLRTINPSDTGQYAATVRRNALDKSRLGDYVQGRDSAEAKRLGLMQAAVSAYPTGSGLASGYADDLRAADSRYERLKDQGQAISDIFTPVFESIGASSDEELKRKL